MWRKRAVIFLLLIILVHGLLIGRLMQIQLMERDHFSKHEINLLEASVKQRSQVMTISNGRGKFLERNGEPLIYETLPVLILFPFLKYMDWDREKVAKIVGVSEEELLEAVQGAKEPIVFGNPPLLLTDHQMNEINELQIPGVFAVDKQYMMEDFPAEHLIGIIGENEQELKRRYPDKDLPPYTMIGLTGLEKSFDEFLLTEGEEKLIYHVDGRGGPLFGLEVRYVDAANPFYPVNVKTTLDKNLQLMAEKLVDKHNIEKGGILLLDIETNSVLANVSRPKINRKSPFADENIKNMLVTEQIPGSIFKTVIAAAAIEEQLEGIEGMFDCNVTIMGLPDPNYQHGQLNFTESFARSCNNTFATLAKHLQKENPETIEHYAEKLSLIGPVSWQGDIFHMDNFQQLQEEEKGRVFLDEEARKDSNYVAMTGIGQHEVRVTPLAVANMMATIARGGKKEMVRFVSEVQYKNGQTLVKFPKKTLDNQMISPYTAMKLQTLLREVVINENGTGRGLQNLPYEVAGKSGTAETGIFTEEGQLVNQWFAGYFPYEKPKYVLVAVRLGVHSGSVIPLYREMVEEIYRYDQFVKD